MGGQSAEGMLSRNLHTLAAQEPDLLPVAGSLVKHLTSKGAYTAVGSESRDARARDLGEFREDFPVLGEISIGVEAEMESLHAA